MLQQYCALHSTDADARDCSATALVVDSGQNTQLILLERSTAWLQHFRAAAASYNEQAATFKCFWNALFFF